MRLRYLAGRMTDLARGKMYDLEEELLQDAALLVHVLDAGREDLPGDASNLARALGCALRIAPGELVEDRVDLAERRHLEAEDLARLEARQQEGGGAEPDDDVADDAAVAHVLEQ